MRLAFIHIILCFFVALPTSVHAQQNWDYTQSGDISGRVNKHIWLPTGNLNRGGFLFGTTMQIGFESYKVGGLFLGIDVCFPSKVKEPFTYVYEGETKTSNRYQSVPTGYISFEHHTFKIKRLILYPSIAIGTSSILFTENASIKSLNISTGIGVKYFFLGGIPAYIQVKHSYLDYKNNNGSSFSGDAFSINSGFSLYLGVH